MNEKKLQKEIKKLYKDYIGSDEELKKKMLEVYQKYATLNNLKLNPNQKILLTILEGLLRNLRVYDECYCPCRIILGNPGKDKGKICPCQDYEEEVERDGYCHCRLFVK